MPTTTRTKTLPVATELSFHQETPYEIWPSTVVSRDYLTIIFESFLGQLFPFQGLFLLNEAGQIVQSNTKARELCQGLNQATAAVNNAAITLPSKVKTLCKFLVDGRLEFPGQPLQLREDIFLGTGLRVHIKAEWINLKGQDTPYILVRLEDITQTAGQRALCDAIRYGLTPRETEVWKLYLQGLSYREVGEKLFIALTTVKKHMKNVYSKRRYES